MSQLPKTQIGFDPVTEDIAVDPETNQIIRVHGSESIKQTLRERLLLVLGEWFLRTDQGLPWFTELAGRDVPIEKVRSFVTATIVQTWGVEELITLDVALLTRTRRLFIQFTYRDIYGKIMEARF